MNRAGEYITQRVRVSGFLLAVAALFVAAGCNDAGDAPFSPTPVGGLTIDAIVSSMAVGGVPAQAREGAAPPPEDGPEIRASGNDSIINGGTLSVTVTADAPFSRLHMLVAVPSEGIAGSAPGLADGYYELQLPSPQTSATVLLTFPQEIPLESIDLRFAAESPGAVVGPYESLSVSVIQVGTGDVQIALSWDADSDVDLHVVAPDGSEIYYANPRSVGGELDLDSNAGCSIDGTRNENVTWPTGTAPAGTYTVLVDHWDSCGVAQTNYTVRINNGGNVQVFTGSLTGEGTHGGVGSGVIVATFTRSSGSTVTSSLTPATPAQALKARRNP